MLCELVMNGIGGRTIEEAKARLTYLEFLKWVEFRRKKGSLHLGMRAEFGFAQLAAIYVNAHSKKGGYKVADFMPHAEAPPEQELTLDDLKAVL